MQGPHLFASNRCSNCPSRDFGPCRAAGAATLRTMAAISSPAIHEAGDTIIAQGETVHHVGIVRSGVVKITNTTADGRHMVIGLIEEGRAAGINPFDHGSAKYTDIMKTQALKQALDKYGFDAAFGGARRDEEKSRAKERIFSFRNASHGWDPKNQRPEMWKIYNTRVGQGESIRVFPLSNWTELDIWQYIYQENIPIVPLYFAARRPVVERDGMLIMKDDDRMELRPEETLEDRLVRFRTLGCYPLTGALESGADTLEAIIKEMLIARTSERQGRLIDHDESGSMEKKKREGYF